MADQTAIEWTDSTFSPWTGCTKISPACDHCYAESWSKRAGARVGKWGPGAPRVRTAPANWRKPVQWNAKPFYECHRCCWRGDTPSQPADGGLWFCPACKSLDVFTARRRVFCASLADVFDNEVDPQWRDDLFDLIAATPNLDWLLLTKRIGNVRGMLPATWTIGATKPWPNVWLGATICNQAEADRDVPKLLAIPAAKRFLSIEPMLGPVDMAWAFPDTRTGCCHRCGFRTNRVGGICPNDGETLRGDIGVDWVIAGGESGPKARPMHPDWVRSLRDQCAAARVPFMFKQWGEWVDADSGPDDDEAYEGKPDCWVDPSGRAHDGALGVDFFHGTYAMYRVGKKAAGNTLDGRQHLEWPR